MPHYYSSRQSSRIVLKPIKISLRGISLQLLTSSGVFSKNKLDKGTEILIKNMIIHSGWDVLDLGCGYGAIGFFAAKLAGSIPYMTDTNARACETARLNAKNNNINAVILQGSLYHPVDEKKFDTILINPPQSAGKDICYAMIEGSINHLKKNGMLQLVARPNKGGKTLSLKIKEAFGNLNIIVRQSGYAVYAGIKNE